MNNEMENEIWKKYPEYPLIEGSSIGRVRTLDRLVVCKNGRKQFVKGRVLKQRLKKNDYIEVGFNVNGKYINRSVHRIIASCFIPNPDNLPQVNHRDNNPANNNASNLEWCSPEYNMTYREKYGTALNRPVYAVDLKTLEVLRFESQHEASRKLEVVNQSVNAVLKGRQKTAYGYWFVNDDGNAVEFVKNKLHDIGGTGLKL